MPAAWIGIRTSRTPSTRSNSWRKERAPANSGCYRSSWGLSPRAQAYREGLEAKRVNARVHLRKILALAEIHGKDEVARALDDGLELQAFSAEYIANILGARRRASPEPAALQLTRRADLLELELPEPDLSIYDHDPGDD